MAILPGATATRQDCAASASPGAQAASRPHMPLAADAAMHSSSTTASRVWGAVMAGALHGLDEGQETGTVSPTCFLPIHTLEKFFFHALENGFRLHGGAACVTSTSTRPGFAGSSGPGSRGSGCGLCPGGGGEEGGGGLYLCGSSLQASRIAPQRLVARACA